MTLQRAVSDRAGRPGKSTTIKILCTLANPTSGSARVAGYDVLRRRDTVRRNIGLVFLTW
jgi:ABC-2 type transport system ATP-binding protein